LTFAIYMVNIREVKSLLLFSSLKETAMPTEEALARAQVLQNAGFLNVTDLPVRAPDYTTRLIVVAPEWLGHWTVQRGQLILVTPDGEIWIGYAEVAAKMGLHLRFCPNGEADFDIHTEDEGIFIHHIALRRKDPYAYCNPEPLANWKPPDPLALASIDAFAA
jgi:hypothetical protein